MTTSTINWRCDGAAPHTPGDVKHYPQGKSGGTLILCKSCWGKENDRMIAVWSSRGWHGDKVANWQSAKICPPNQIKVIDRATTGPPALTVGHPVGHAREAAEARIQVLEAANANLLAVLHEVREYLDQRADVADYSDETGHTPNEEMKLLAEVDEAIAIAKENQS